MSDDVLRYVRIEILAKSCYLAIFVLGVIGNIFNLMVFCGKKLRSNSCSIYFIFYTLNNFLNLTVGLLLWSLTIGFGFRWEYELRIYCKTRRYFTHVFFLLSSCLLTMASFNRYARVRQAQLTIHRDLYMSFCRRRTSCIVSLLTVAFCLIINIHIPIFFEIKLSECYPQDQFARLTFDLFFLFFYTVVPPVLMIGINIATIIEIRSIRRLVQPKISRREYNFIFVVLLHSISNAIFTLPFSVQKFFHYFYEDQSNDEVFRLIFCITLLIAFTNPALSFFLYTLTTRSFRKEFFRSWKSMPMKCSRKTN